MIPSPNHGVSPSSRTNTTLTVKLSRGKHSGGLVLMLEKTWIGATGQRWKVYVMFGLMGLTVGCFPVPIVFGDRLSLPFGIWMILISLVVGLIFMLWAFFAIYCPFCGCRIIWTVLRALPHQESIAVAFFFLTHCPKCKQAFFEWSFPPNRSEPYK